MPNKHIITLADAAVLTSRYRTSVTNPSGALTQKIGGSFNKEAIELLMDNPNFNGLRFYFALNANKEMSVVLVGVDENGDDLTDDVILDFAEQCPTICGCANALNS